MDYIVVQQAIVSLHPLYKVAEILFSHDIQSLDTNIDSLLQKFLTLTLCTQNSFIYIHNIQMS